MLMKLETRIHPTIILLVAFNFKVCWWHEKNFNDSGVPDLCDCMASVEQK